MYPVSNAIINMVIKMKSYKDIVWLFGINVFISTFTFGGGYVVIPMIRKYYVEKKAYFDEGELCLLYTSGWCRGAWDGVQLYTVYDSAD